MNIKVNRDEPSRIGLLGHIGVGHIHSHQGYIQDDSVGFIVLVSILKKIFNINTKIKDIIVDCDASILEVELEEGGIGRSYVRRGISIWEKDMLKAAIGKDALYNQKVVLETFGRIYGQGVTELPVAFQGAMAMAIANTFLEKYPNDFLGIEEGIGDNVGQIIGCKIKINNIPLSLLLTINASKGGIGPVEDLEGNVFLGNKAKIMKELNLDKIPSIIIESKNYYPELGSKLNRNHFYVRGHKDLDNSVVYESLLAGVQKSDLDYIADDQALFRGDNDFIQANLDFADKLIELAEGLKKANSSVDKVNIISKMAILISQDAGGISFMSNDLHKSVGGAGMLRGTSAVLSLLVSQDYIDYYKIPYLSQEDIKNYIKIIFKAISVLDKNFKEAEKELKNKYKFNQSDFQKLI